jgi:hypothetical protein
MRRQPNSREPYFENAADFFSKLSLPQERRKYHFGDIYEYGRIFSAMETAGVAAAMLYSLGEDRLKEMEQTGDVDPSTISGGSLPAAARAVSRFFMGRGRVIDLTYSEREQLAATCRSALGIYRKRLA